ncbi:hypothetical protein E2C01_021226 [Portunus trituberculatus]|uniref:Uncharacterized protein n=1 Tax=Portunus trituberculatus TaxID=210409 RepID=A0A5B7E5I3_PORTR|nr:hypothetical protein [Portunus trituberculatus]
MNSSQDAGRMAVTYWERNDKAKVPSPVSQPRGTVQTFAGAPQRSPSSPSPRRSPEGRRELRTTGDVEGIYSG